MSEVVTGDAVIVEVRVAQPPIRALALLVDLVVQWTVLTLAFLLLADLAAVSDPALYATANLLLVVLITVGYPVAFESLSRGRSVGKLALGLRVVSDDGGPERFRQALFRGLAGFLEFWLLFGAPALISALLSQRGKRLGDLFAGTIVISERGPRDTAAPTIELPPPLARWAETLELSQLPDDVAAAARQCLLRWPQLSPRTQQELGGRVAAQVAASISPPAPPGVTPHAFLSAVLAERRRREEARLARRRLDEPAVSRSAASTASTPSTSSTASPPSASPTSPTAGDGCQAPHVPTEQPRSPAPPGPTPGGFAPPA